MNTRHYYLRLLRTLALAALTAAAAAACSDDTDNDREPLTPPDASDGIPVTFTANINPGSDADPADAPDTRTILTPDGGGFTVTWKGMSDFIRIWAAMGNTLENNGNYKTYVPTTSAASSGLVPRDASNKLTLSSTGEWKFTAVYGESGAGNREADAVLSPLSQSEPNNTEHIATADFSVATAEQTVAANSEMPAVINFKFEHKLSALQLRVTNQTGEALTIKEIRLSADGGQIASYRTYDVATGKWKTDEEQKAAYLKLTASSFPALATGGASQDLHMLLFPGYENDTLTVTVITSRGEYSLTKRAPDGGFLAGKNYLTDITLRTDGLTADEKWVQYISNKAELIAFRERVNNGIDKGKLNARLLANIDLTDETWTPIGTDENKPFSGTFEGSGYRISNLSVDNGSNDNAGLFGYVVEGTVRNLRVSGTVTTTGKYAGGIAGQLINSSTVENCLFGGTVSGGNQSGGIAGNIFGGSSRVAGCYTKGSVTVTNFQNAGGIVGTNSDGTITDCYSEAEVTANNQSAGGIAGRNGSTITHCYATGKVSGKSYVGGIVGIQSGTLTNCIALNPGLERTEGTNKVFGRIAGYVNSGSIFTSCAAFDGMTIKDVNTTDFYADATGEHGAALPAADCLTPAAYISRDFTEATATTPGWAFDSGTWTYLPWNPAFETFPGITDPDQYRIKVPTHLNGGGSVN